MDLATKTSDEILTMSDVAEEFKVNVSTVSRWISRHGLKSMIAGKKMYLIKRSDLDHFLETNEVIKTKKSQPDPESD